jgi:hypothetical protein
MITPRQVQHLQQLASAVTQGCIVEVGSYRGRSTVALAEAAQVPVYAVEPHEEFTGMLGREFGPEDRAAFYKTMLKTGAYEKVRLVNLSSEVVTPGWSVPVGLLWIDGDHRYEAVSRDFRCWEPHLAEAAPVVFDDSTNPDVGPYRLIEDLKAEGWHVVEVVDKSTVMTRR